MTTAPIDDPIAALALLDEPNRRRLYDLVTASAEPLGRDAAAAALGISRELVAFHLDRLAAAGLLDTERRRLGARRGPGAGRPAKLYRRSSREVAISLPTRHYERLAGLFAAALERMDGPRAAEATAAVAHERGVVLGRDARRAAGPRPARQPLRRRLMDLLQHAGYEPAMEASTDRIWLRNCPYDALVADHRDLTCGLNLAWAQGVVEGLGDSTVSVELAPESGRCCVVFHDAAAGRRPPRNSDVAKPAA